jgi:N-carbamoylputrescine amidase
LDFWGRSFIADPSGQILAKAGEEKPEIVIASIDPKALDLQRTHWPFLRDRRIEAYADLTKRFID